MNVHTELLESDGKFFSGPEGDVNSCGKGMAQDPYTFPEDNGTHTYGYYISIIVLATFCGCLVKEIYFKVHRYQNNEAKKYTYIKVEYNGNKTRMDPYFISKEMISELTDELDSLLRWFVVAPWNNDPNKVVKFFLGRKYFEKNLLFHFTV